MMVATNPKQQRPAHDESRKDFYDWLAETISIDGITSVVRDHEFVDDHYRSGGIRLHYGTQIGILAGLKIPERSILSVPSALGPPYCLRIWKQ